MYAKAEAGAPPCAREPTLYKPRDVGGDSQLPRLLPEPGAEILESDPRAVVTRVCVLSLPRPSLSLYVRYRYGLMG